MGSEAPDEEQKTRVRPSGLCPNVLAEVNHGLAVEVYMNDTDWKTLVGVGHERVKDLKCYQGEIAFNQLRSRGRKAQSNAAWL